MKESQVPLSYLQIGGLKIQLMSFRDSLDAVFQGIHARPARIFFVNAHCVTVAQRDPYYQMAVHQAEFVFNDGAGIELAGRLLGAPVKGNLNGTDWIPAFFDRLDASKDRHRVFFLGGTPELVQSRGGYLSEQWPNLLSVGSHHGYFEDDAAVLAAIEKARPEVLLVCMGVPKQELFLEQHWNALVNSGVKVAIAGGAVFDFLTGKVPRSPRWMRLARLEWLYRLWIEPRRLWRRYVMGAFPFAWLLIKEWFRKV